jgi:hypothetical protein
MTGPCSSRKALIKGSLSKESGLMGSRMESVYLKINRIEESLHLHMGSNKDQNGWKISQMGYESQLNTLIIINQMEY